MSVHHERNRSGRWHARRTTCMAPQSWPTRSTGSPMASSSVASHATYSSAVAPKPSGTGAPNPGGDRVRTSVRPNSARSGDQTAAVSGLPCTKTAVTSSTVRSRSAPRSGPTGLRADETDAELPTCFESRPSRRERRVVLHAPRSSWMPARTFQKSRPYRAAALAEENC